MSSSTVFSTLPSLVPLPSHLAANGLGWVATGLAEERDTSASFLCCTGAGTERRPDTDDRPQPGAPHSMTSVIGRLRHWSRIAVFKGSKHDNTSNFDDYSWAPLTSTF